MLKETASLERSPVARWGLLMQLGERSRRPSLFVDDRWLPMLRARRGHGR
jgi:hypothetical protein